jgi:hypothetical protein
MINPFPDHLALSLPARGVRIPRRAWVASQRKNLRVANMRVAALENGWFTGVQTYDAPRIARHNQALLRGYLVA